MQAGRSAFPSQEGIMARIILVLTAVLVLIGSGLVAASKTRPAAGLPFKVAGCINGQCS
jgi:hypothetical protein